VLADRLLTVRVRLRKLVPDVALAARLAPSSTSGPPSSAAPDRASLSAPTPSLDRLNGGEKPVALAAARSPTSRLSGGTRSCADAHLRWAQRGPTQANVRTRRWMGVGPRTHAKCASGTPRGERWDFCSRARSGDCAVARARSDDAGDVAGRHSLDARVASALRDAPTSWRTTASLEALALKS
jgi:hypothetical protein